MIPNVLLNQLLTGIGAHILVIAGKGDAGEFADGFCNGGAIDYAADVVSAMADVKANPDLTV